jgi:prenylcysteine oxidase/farnesylcysteine lyase
MASLANIEIYLVVLRGADPVSYLAFSG